MDASNIKKRHLKWKLFFTGDIPLWICFFFLLMVSLVSVYTSVGFSAVGVQHSTPWHVFMKHCAIVAGTIFVAIFISKLKTNFYDKLGWAMYVVSVVVLLYAVATGKGRFVPILGRPFQISELAKIATIIVFAVCLHKFKKDPDNKQRWVGLVAVVLLTVVPVFVDDNSTAFIMVVVYFFMLFFSGVNDKTWWRLLGLFIVLLAIVLVVIYFFGENSSLGRIGTAYGRIHSFIHPDFDAPEQENIARMAVARGYPFGAGIGNTIHGRLMNEAHNDFIFAIIIEEVGYISLFIPLAYLYIFIRCMLIASRSRDVFSQLIVSGFGLQIFIQAFMNMLVSVGMFPVTGQTLPFVSYGGMSFICLGVGIGMVQGVAQRNKVEKKAAMMAAQASDNQVLVNEEASCGDVDNNMNQNIETI